MADTRALDNIGKTADDPCVQYPGGKGKCFQRIINIFPPHNVYIETHLGGGAVLRNKRAATRSIGIDRDGDVISFWRSTYPQLAEYVHGDAIPLLRSYEFKGSELVYCDPPYLPSARRRNRVYRHDLSEPDHCALLETLVLLPCFVVLSGYHSKLYESRLKDWTCLKFLAKAQHGLCEECLWFNYPLPERLHDTRFFGANYRERQDFRRRMERLRQRILRLSRPEQYDLVNWLSRQLGHGETTTDATSLLSQRR